MSRRLNSEAAGRGEENHILAFTTMHTVIVVCKGRSTKSSVVFIQGIFFLAGVGDQAALHDVSLGRANRGAFALGRRIPEIVRTDCPQA